MPEANKIKKDEVMVDLDTSGPDTEVSLPEDKVEEVVEEKQEAVSTEQETTEEKPVKDEPLSETEIEQETSRRVNRGQVSPIGQVTEITPDMTLEEIKPRLKGGIYNLLK